MNNKSKYANVILLSLVWGILYAAQGYANKNVSTYTTGVFVFTITIALLLVTLISKNTFKDLFTVKALFPKLLLIGLIGFSVNLTNFIGFQYGSAQTGAFILKTDVIMINFVSLLIYKEKFTKKDWFLSALMFVGVLLILEIDFTKMTFAAGDIMFIVSAMLLTWNTFNIKNILSQEKTPITQMTVAFYNALITMTLFITMFIATGAISDIGIALSRKDVLLSLVIGGVFQYALYIMYYKALAELPAWIVKVILLLIPVVTLVITIFLYGTMPSGAALIGCVLVLLSAYGIIKHQQVKDKEKANA